MIENLACVGVCFGEAIDALRFSWGRTNSYCAPLVCFLRRFGCGLSVAEGSQLFAVGLGWARRESQIQFTFCDPLRNAKRRRADVADSRICRGMASISLTSTFSQSGEIAICIIRHRHGLRVYSLTLFRILQSKMRHPPSAMGEISKSFMKFRS